VLLLLTISWLLVVAVVVRVAVAVALVDSVQELGYL
jgi:hypothetical protein